MKTKKIFALDIGTRKVMGLVAVSAGDSLRVLDSESREHPTRAMSAGQIQDVPKVTQVVKQIVAALAKRTGEPLKEAAVAVAGRNLRTLIGRAALECPKDRPLEDEDVEKATYDALEDALMRLSVTSDDASRPKARYYCVGYVVSRFLLDGEALSQPRGHRGERLQAEVLASFLPWQVLESQLAVLEGAGLEASSVTLEPIAALQAVVDQDLRQFDLALVDVGAGTSDIAVVSGGQVRAFGMVACAGDFVTEALAERFLIDFQTAERVKRSVSLLEGPVEALTILQQPLTLQPSEVFAAMAPAVAEMAKQISCRILELGAGKAPRMVLCVGGGSRTPGLYAELADALGMSPHCVGTRPPGLGLGLKDAAGRALGPETATPLGIACVAASAGGVRFQNVFVNGERFYLLEIGRPLTVLSALMAAGVSAKKIFGWPGESMTFTLNGGFRVLQAPGTGAAKLKLNGKGAKLDDRVRDGDEIGFEATEPAPHTASITDAIGLAPIRVTVNGHVKELWPRITVEGLPAAPSELLRDRMAIELGAVLMADALSEEERRQGHVHCNGHLVSLSSALHDGDKIETLEHNRTELPSGLTHLMEEAAHAGEGEALIGSAAESPSSRGSVGLSIEPRAVAEAPVAAMRKENLQISLNGEWISLDASEDGAILVDVLKRVAMPAGGYPGKRLKLLLNGQEASFTSPLRSGAEVRVFFE